MTNKLILPVESRMQGDLHVRFGGRLWETYHRKVVRRPSPSLHVKYADEPKKLSIEMKDFLSPTDGRLPSNRSDIYFKELGNESPVLVKLMMQTIYQNDRRCIKHIGAQQFGMKFLLRGLYAHNGLLYFHTRMENGTNMPYSVDFITFKVVDKKVAKRTAIQEQVLQPLRAYHQVMQVKGKDSEHSVFVLEQF
ncbi:conjugative transposon TraN protein, partial [Prevotella disiens JCM 6334 = ATCC 29426]